MAVQSYYYSGQGEVLVAPRNVTTGVPEGFTSLGNIPELTIDIETTTFEHKESMTGDRLVDLVIVKEKKGTLTMKLESLTLENLALGLWGGVTAVTGAAVTAEPVKAYLDKVCPLAHPDVSLVAVKGPGGTPTYTVVTDYILDAANGTITPTTAGAIVDLALLEVDYTYAAGSTLDAFTSAAAPERWFRFQGLNTIDNQRVLIDIFKVQLEPLSGYGLINEELGSVDIKGTIVADLLRATGSRFFTQRKITI